MTDTVTVGRELLRQIAEWSYLGNGPEQLYQLQKALRAALEAEPVAKAMTAHRAAYFMERFKKEEKLLGPNEQAAVDFVIDMLTATQAPQPAPVQEPDAIGCKCSVCGEWQRWTPSGMVCKNGHGGADGINHRLYTQPRKAVKLSDSEVREIYENHAYVDCTGMLRAIEAAVWEKLGVTE